MFYYMLKNKVLISREKYPLPEIPAERARTCPGLIYLMHRKDPDGSRRSFSVSDPSLAFLAREGLDLLIRPRVREKILPGWVEEKIFSGQVAGLNPAYPGWEQVLDYRCPDRWKVNVIGLGDVGGTLLTGLRLLGGERIKEIGIYDRDARKMKRWDYEANQIFSPFSRYSYPEVRAIDETEVFDCDLFVFCVSAGVPPPGAEQEDVRLVQWEANSRIIRHYAQRAREDGFRGIFAVVSDPVDLLCREAFVSSNTNEKGERDYFGLAPEQIRGYGLGVMHARAVYFARRNPETIHYTEEGRAFGPHGAGLVIADSILRYNDRLSRDLTDQARKANLEVRGTGYKPYIAPALSSGALPLMATMSGDWHYSATFMGGVFMGAKNRLTPSGVEIERLDLPQGLWQRLQETYEMLGGYGK